MRYIHILCRDIVNVDLVIMNWFCLMVIDLEWVMYV